MAERRGRTALGLVGLTVALQAVRLLVAADALRGGDVVTPGRRRGARDAAPEQPGASSTADDLGTGSTAGPLGADDEGGPVTVLVPVRSGDPLLAATLAEQVQALTAARTVFLVDDDDAPARAAAEAARARAPRRVVVRSFERAAPGTNPKVAKLAAAQPQEGVVVLLDDDTVLPADALTRMIGALRHGDLVTGVPAYREQGSVWSRLLAAFVNGGAVLTHPVLARVAPPVTVNGMALVCRAATLASLGGLASIAHEVCDDYALARLVRGAGGRVVQTTVAHPVATTVTSAREYARIQRRWLLFAQQVVRRDLSVPMVGLVLLPSVLPLASLVGALRTRSLPALAGVLGAGLTKAVLTRELRRRVAPGPWSRRGVAFEVVADLLTPVHLAAAAVGTGEVPWRDRQVVTGPARVPVAVRAAVRSGQRP